MITALFKLPPTKSSRYHTFFLAGCDYPGPPDPNGFPSKEWFSYFSCQVCFIKLPSNHWAWGYLILTHDFTQLLC